MGAEFSKDLSYEFWSILRDQQKEQGKKQALDALRHAAQDSDSYILANPVNETSFAHFLRPDVRSKNFTVQRRTARAGILDGFIPKQEGFEARPLTFVSNGHTYIAVERRGKQLLTAHPLPDDTVIEASCYSDGSFIVSDIDLLFIIPKKTKASQIILDPVYGELTLDEKEIIEKINSTFSQNLNLIAHGPANRFSRSKISHIHFPITIVTPEGNIFLLGEEDKKDLSIDELFSFLHSIKKLGYSYAHNPRWSFDV